jgi:hypothetical protein
MMAILGMLVFASAFAASVAVFAFTLVPALPRIVALLSGEGDPALVDRPLLILNDRRLRTRFRSPPLARPRMLRVAA